MLDVIKGEKVSLRPITLEDMDLILKWRNNPDVKQSFVYQKPLTAEEHINWMKTRVKSGEVVQFIILNNAGNIPIGSVYFRDVDKENRSAEYGIFIGEKSCFSKGYGSETAKLFLDFGFNTLHLHRIFLRVFSDNERAIKSYLNAGFSKEGIAKDMIFQNGRYRSMLFMSKISGE